MLNERERSWIEDARTELEAARVLTDSGFYHLAVFHARQALEKLLKAAFPILGKGHMPHEHSLQAMVHRLFGRIPDPIWTIIKQMNAFYMSTRYVDAAGGPPSTRFDRDDAEKAVELAQEAFEWLSAELAEKS